ncbi:serine/threonine-protein kinase HAL4/sat4 [Apophysomyces ossiformis]|uniref:non-specific serine/threonine protein kinase n=1 Tax=Apophysomyces ossiformis TaxID=679940 RepID=A0A8H7ETA3_9FUNG|nr:serine/threonine-protein kinase HAL4/sat4 [Apophysomyces ossiformis]
MSTRSSYQPVGSDHSDCSSVDTPSPISSSTSMTMPVPIKSSHHKAFSGLRMTRMDDGCYHDDDEVVVHDAELQGPSRSNSSIRSTSSSLSSKLSRSFSQLLSSSFKKNQRKRFDGEESLQQKYGEYVKRKTMTLKKKEKVATGATAVIRLVQQESRILAVKEFKKREKSESAEEYEIRVRNECALSMSVSGHPNVVETIERIKNERGRCCLVMEYCAGGDLFNLCQSEAMDCQDQECLFKQLLLGLQHLHHHNVAHRDIKPENLVLTKGGGTLKIADFGVACSPADECHRWCGSEPFWSPEMWTLKSKDSVYDGRALDVWSAAITFFCLRNFLPFDCAYYNPIPQPPPKHADPSSPAVIASKELNGGCPLYGRYHEERRKLGASQCELFKDLPENMRDCLAGMLDPDPKTRWTVDQALASEWLSGVETCTDGVLSNGWRHSHRVPICSK